MMNPQEVTAALRAAATEVQGLPKKDPRCVEAVPKTISKKGYDTTGIKLAFMWEVLLKHIPANNLRVSSKVLNLEQKEGAEKWNPWCASMSVNVAVVDGAEILAEATAYGGHEAKIQGDALKGAETNGLKKALMYWGIGIDAYKGVLDEDAVIETPPAKPSAYLPPTDAEQEAMEDLLKMDDQELRDLAVGMAQEVKDKMTIDLRKVCMSKVVSISQMKLPLAKDVRPGLALIVLRANAMLKTTQDEAA